MPEMGSLRIRHDVSCTLRRRVFESPCNGAFGNQGGTANFSSLCRCIGIFLSYRKYCVTMKC